MSATHPCPRDAFGPPFQSHKATVSIFKATPSNFFSPHFNPQPTQKLPTFTNIVIYELKMVSFARGAIALFLCAIFAVTMVAADAKGPKITNKVCKCSMSAGAEVGGN